MIVTCCCGPITDSDLIAVANPPGTGGTVMPPPT